MVFGTEGLPPRAAVMEMLNAAWVSHAVRTMADLGLADLLAERPRDIGEVAEATGTHVPTLTRFFRALSAIGLCATDGEGRIRLTPRGELLRSYVPGSMRSYALAIHAPHIERSWDNLTEAVRTGQPVFPSVHGLDFWEYLAADPEKEALFDSAMSGGAESRARALLASRDLTGLDVIVDVGGGQGELLAAVLAATPSLRGVLFDRPEALPGAEAILTAAGVAGRCDLVGGDFFASVPVGGDAYVLALIVHDWPDDAAIAILRTCHRAMAPGARVWVIERVIELGDAYDPAKLIDLLMLVIFGAQERTAEEYGTLLRTAGFESVTVHSTGSPFSVVEGIRP